MTIGVLLLGAVFPVALIMTWVYFRDRLREPVSVVVITMTLGGVFNGQDPKFLAEYCSRVPMGRMADRDDYNGAVVFLLSNASAYMTGSNLVIDGGWTAW